MFIVGKKDSAVVLLKLHQLCRTIPHARVSIIGEGGCVSPSWRLCAAYLLEPATEHLLLERVHAANCAWLSDWKVVNLYGNIPLGNCPQLVVVLFKGISSLVGRLEHWQISLCCLLTVSFPNTRRMLILGQSPHPAAQVLICFVSSQKTCTSQCPPWTCRGVKWIRSKQVT